ncbi:hypothetical protein EJB05_30676, partial [Eragrostis curvula]
MIAAFTLSRKSPLGLRRSSDSTSKEMLSRNTRETEGRSKQMELWKGDKKKEDSQIKPNRTPEPPKITCFRCLQEGHHQRDCENEPVCYKCKASGHMAAECAGLKQLRKIKMFGFGIPGQGFYSIEIPEGKDATKETTGLVTVLQGEANEDKIDGELKNLIDPNWDWKVRRVAEEEYVVIFPNTQALDTFSKMADLRTTIYGLKIKISKSAVDPEASSLLHTVWVKIYGLPGFARAEDIVKEVASLAAEPIVVDELSLIRNGPVRVKVRSRDPANLRGFIEIFFNHVGYDIRFLVEGFQAKNSKKGDGPAGDDKGKGDGPSRKNNSKTDKQDKSRENDTDSESDEIGGEDVVDEINKNHCRTEKGEQKVTTQKVSENKEEGVVEEFSDEMNANCESSFGDIKYNEDALPLAAFDPSGEGKLTIFVENLGREQQREDSHSGENELQRTEKVQSYPGICEEKKKRKAIELLIEGDGTVTDKGVSDRKGMQEDVPAGKILVHNIDGAYLMDEGKWPWKPEGPKEQMEVDSISTLLQPCEEGNNVHDAEDVMFDNMSVNEEGDISSDGEDQGWSDPIQKKTRPKNQKGKRPVIPMRASTRVPRDGKTIQEKAELRAKAKNLETGTFSLSETIKANPFTLLNAIPNEHLNNVIEDLDLVVEEGNSLIDSIRAEELARAVIAEANYKAFLAKQAERDGETDDVESLAMEVIDNTIRERDPSIQESTEEVSEPVKRKGQPSSLAWALWKNRNKMAIRKTFPNKPTDVMMSGIAFLQKWSILLKEDDKVKMEAITVKILAWVQGFQPRDVAVTDIVVL